MPEPGDTGWTLTGHRSTTAGCQPLQAFEGTLDCGAVGAEALGEISEARLGRGPPGVGHHPNGRRQRRQPAVGVQDGDGIELPSGRTDRPLQVGGLGVEDPIELTAEGARHLASLDFEKGAGGSGAPQEGADGFAALGRDHPTAPSDAPRGRQPELTELSRQYRRVVGRNHEFEVGATSGQAQ